jgi:hypothetical protein
MIVDIRHVEIFAIVLMLLPLYVVAVTSSVAFEGRMETEAVGNLRAKVYGVSNLLDGYKTMVDSGMMTKDEAIGWIGDIICGPRVDERRAVDEGIRIGERGYMIVWSLDGITKIHPYQEGKDLKEINPDLYRVITSGDNEGVYRYMQTYDKEVPEEKIVYFSKYAPWGLIIGATDYISEYKPPSLPISLFMLLAISVITVILIYTIFGIFSKKRTFFVMGALMLVILLLSSATAVSSSEFSEWKQSSLIEELGSKVRFAIAMCYSFKAMADSGMMTKDEAIGWIGDIICGPRVDGKRDIARGFLTGREGYMDIFDENGTYLVHPFYEGKNTKEFGSERYETVMKEKEGLISYRWQNSGDPQPREKIEAFGFFAPWGLFVLSTAYVDEYMEPVMTMRNYMASAIALVAFASLFSIFLSNELRKVRGND